MPTVRLLAEKTGNLLDRRMRLLEGFVLDGLRTARYNDRLLGEYSAHVRHHRNDIVEVFLR
jgi:hypothetical protein